MSNSNQLHDQEPWRYDGQGHEGIIVDAAIAKARG